MRSDILKLLTDSKGYISGEEISGKLGISRAAVWKNIKQLKEDGGVVEAQTNRGYRLVSLPDILKPEYVGCYTARDMGNVTWLQSVDSTNDEAKRQAREGEPGGAIFVAETQFGGKGRLGRKWESAPGDSVMLSFLLRPDIRPQQAPAFNIAAALGIVRGIERVCGISAGIKWPNDVVYDGKKLCGILTEMTSDMDTVEYVVCGMGTNVNQASFPEEIAHKATSLRIETGERVDRLRLCAAYIECVEEIFAMYMERGMGAIMAEYRERSAILGSEVRVLGLKQEYSGICRGFDEDGGLIVECEDGRRVFNAGEVSVRGVNGYV